MGVAFGIMIEGQEGLTWERWRRLAGAAEEHGDESLFRSGHLTGLTVDPKRPSPETWASLAWLATASRRIRFGPLVSPLTFYQPALPAKRGPRRSPSCRAAGVTAASARAGTSGSTRC